MPHGAGHSQSSPAGERPVRKRRSGTGHSQRHGGPAAKGGAAPGIGVHRGPGREGRSGAGITAVTPAGCLPAGEGRAGPAGVAAWVSVLSAVSAVDGEVRGEVGWGTDLHLVGTEFHLRRGSTFDVARRDRER